MPLLASRSEPHDPVVDNPADPSAGAVFDLVAGGQVHERHSASDHRDYSGADTAAVCFEAFWDCEYMKIWGIGGYIYILKCSDDSFYVGQTWRPVSRLKAHYTRCGSSYTKARWPVRLVYIIRVKDVLPAEAKIREVLKRFGLHLVKKYNPSDIVADDLHDKVLAEIEREVVNIDPLAIIRDISYYVKYNGIPICQT